MEQITQSKALRTVFALVLAFALSIPSALLAPSEAWAAGETVTTTVDGLPDGTLPVLTAGSANPDGSMRSGDFVLGQPVNADPVEYTDASGNRPLSDLAKQKSDQGLELKWTDAATGADFSWSETKVTRSTQVHGSWVAKKCGVTLVYADGKTDDRTVTVPWGKSFSSVEQAPQAPTCDGWQFLGWFAADGSQFDFNAPVKDATVVTAKWRVADVTVAPLANPTTDVPQTVDGTCWIGGCWSWHPTHFAVSGFSGYLEGASMEGVCANPSAARPANTRAPYHATLSRIDYDEGKVYYDVVVTPPGATDGHSRNSLGLIGYQRVSGTLSISKNFGGYVEVDKSSSNPAISDGNDCYSLEGAVFAVYSSNGTAVDRITTGADGKAKSRLLPSGSYYVEELSAPKGYALDTDENGDAVKHWGDVASGKTTSIGVGDSPQNDPVSILLGKFDGERAYNGAGNLPLGGASLAGAEFSVEYYDGFYSTVSEAEASGDPTRSWVLATNENGFCHLSNEYKIAGDDFYRDSSGNITLPLGTIVIKETKAPLGYNLPSPFGMEQSFVRQVTSDGSAEDVRTYNMPQQAEPVYRGDVSLKKIGEDQEPFANVPFKISRLDADGNAVESHVMVTDENGYASTKASWNPHTQGTNSNDWLIDGKQGIASLADAVAGIFGASQKPDPTAGVWFNGLQKGEDASAAAGPDDERGALVYGTYLLEELPCDANAGHTLVKKTFKVYRDSTFNKDANVDLGTVTDWNVAIGTEATDRQTATHDLTIDPEAAVVDKVHYKGLRSGDAYRMVGTVMDKSTGEPLKDANGNAVTVSKEFTPTDTEGDVELEFSVATASLKGGQELVVFEKLYKDGDDPVATHEDITDEGQTVKVKEPSGATEAHGTDGEKTVPADGKVTVVDTVSYTDLVVGKEYALTGTLMDKETGKALVDAAGKAVTATTAFTPKDTYGTVDVTFTFDGSLLAGKEIVAFESCERLGKTVFTHEDIADEGQTVLIGEPKASTRLLDSLDSDGSVIADKDASVKDVVSYENLVKGEQYTLYTMLMDTETGLPLVFGAYEADADELASFAGEVKAALGLEGDTSLSADPSKTIDADALKKALEKHSELASHLAYGTTDFAPEETSGEQAVALAVDASQLAGKKTTCYEVLVKDGRVPATHCEKDSTDQQVDFVAPEIGTELTDSSDSDHTILPGTVKLVDSVAYKNLVPGKTYVMKGKLMDKSTGSALIAGDKEVVAEASFVPNSQSGTVEVTFEFDASALPDGAQLVAFEDCYKDGELVATHSDLSDEGQTVTVSEVPEGSFFAKTGADALIAYAAAMVLAAAAAAVSIVALRRRIAADR